MPWLGEISSPCEVTCPGGAVAPSRAGSGAPWVRAGPSPSLPAVPVLNSLAHNASVKCERMRSQKLRRRPDSCHAFHPEVSRDRRGREGQHGLGGTRGMPVHKVHLSLFLHPCMECLMAAGGRGESPREFLAGGFHISTNWEGLELGNHRVRSRHTHTHTPCYEPRRRVTSQSTGACCGKQGSNQSFPSLLV